MPKTKKPVLIFPYHDPKKKFNEYIAKNIDLLKDIFSKIIISVTFPTIKENREIIDFLEKKDCLIFKNEENTKIGDHFRNALKIYLDSDEEYQAYFGFIDRIIFALETEHKNYFIKDVQFDYQNNLVIFSRSKKVWNTHPKSYYLIEKILNDAGIILFNKDLDWIWCGILLNKKIAKIILNESEAKDFSVMAEFLLISYLNNIGIKNKNVDWQEWEAPFWAKISKVKISKKLSQEEKVFRLKYINNAIELFLEKNASQKFW